MSGGIQMMSSLQTLDQNSTQYDANIFPMLSSPHGIHPAGASDATPIRAKHPQSNDAFVNIPPEDSPPTQNGTPLSEQSLSFWPILHVFTFYLIMIALSPFLVVIFSFMRVLQFIRHGRGYYNATLLKLSTRSWILHTIALVGLESFFMIINQSTSHSITIMVKLTKHLSVLPTWLYGVMVVVGIVGNNLPIILCRIIPYQSAFGHDGFYLRDRVLEIIDCLFFWLLESKVVEHVPALKRHNILGLHTYKWIQVSVFVFIGYNVITLFTWVIVRVLQGLFPKKLGPRNNDTILEYSLGGKYIIYCANGLKNSVNFILIALMLLLTWVLYFGSRLNYTPKAKMVLEVGTQTCVSVLVCSVLWLIKTSVLLSWEVTAVYDRLSSELIHGGNQLYFLGLINRHNHDIFSLIYEEDDKQAEENKGRLSKKNIGTQSSSDDDGTTFTYGRNKRYTACIERPLKCLHARLSFLYNNKKPLTQIKWTTLITSPTLIMLRSLDAQMRSESDSEEEDWPKRGKGSFNADQDGTKKKKMKKRLSGKVKERVKNDLVMQEANLAPTLHTTHIVAQYFLNARKALSDDTFSSTAHLEDESNSKLIKESLMKQLIDGENNQSEAKQHSSKDPEESKHKWDHFKTNLSLRQKKEQDLPGINPSTCQQTELSEKIREETELSEKIKAWMERSRNKCLFLANTLYSAKEVVDFLNSIISLLIIATTLIMWLLLTGFATTKVFVLIASPLLAATFIFGDTCKSFFQGIMFVYVVHPFHIGDLCFLDGKMMEVWMVGVWKTIFLEVGTRAEVIYTNTELSTKNIVNYRNDFDWNDSIELEVSSLDSNLITILKGKIEKHLNDHKHNFKSSHNCAKVFTTGSNMKMTISFQHKVDDLEASSTNFERVKRKQELLSTFAPKLHDLLEETKRNANLHFYI